MHKQQRAITTAITVLVTLGCTSTLANREFSSAWKQANNIRTVNILPS